MLAWAGTITAEWARWIQAPIPSTGSTFRRSDSPPPGVLKASAAKSSNERGLAERLETVTESSVVLPGTSFGENTTRGVPPAGVVGYTDQLPLLAAPAGCAAGRPSPTANVRAARAQSQGVRRGLTQR